MSKFSKGDKARVISVDNYDSKEGVKVGDIVTVNQSDSCSPWVILGNGRIHCLMESQIEHYTEAPKEITLNGATYVLKEEPKPEHEWKFGDWARHPEYGVVFVGNVNCPSELWCVIKDSLGWRSGKYITPNELTYISSADIPV